jgi:hypothetical protein
MNADEINKAFDEEYIKYREAFPKDYILPNPRLDQGPDYERGFIDGMQKQMQSSVDRAVNAMSKREWVGLTDAEVERIKLDGRDLEFVSMKALHRFARDIQAKLKEKNT